MRSHTPNRGNLCQHLSRLRIWVAARDKVAARLHDPPFLRGDRAVGRPEDLRVLKGDGRDNRDGRRRNDVRGVKPPAEAHFQHRVADTGRSEGYEGRCGHDVEPRRLASHVPLRLRRLDDG